MRKFFCTATVFVVMAGVLAGVLLSLFVVRMPNVVWWSAYCSFPSQTCALILWINGNILVPAYMALIAGATLFGLWHGSSAICAKIRGEKHV